MQHISASFLYLFPLASSDIIFIIRILPLEVMFSFCQQISLFSMHCRRISDTISTTFDFFSMRPVFLLCLLVFSCFNFLFYIGKKVKVKVTQSYLTLCDPMDCIVQSWNSLGQNTRVDGVSLLQGIFPTQRSNPGLPHCRQILQQPFWIGVQPINNVMVVSDGQRDSAIPIHVSILPQSPLPSRLHIALSRVPCAIQ